MKLTFTNNRNQKIELTSTSPFIVESTDGFGDVGADVQTQGAPYQDGSIYIDSVLEERPLNIIFTISAKSAKDLADKKRLVSSVFNPKIGLGVLEYERNGVVYEIEAASESVPAFPSGSGNRGMMHQKVTLDLLAPNPYWRSPNETTKPLVAYTGNFKLPTKFPFKLGTSGSKTTLYNDGDMPAPVRIEMHGPTTNPQIFNRTTGEYLRINRTIARGEVMHINTESGRQRVVIIDEDGNENSAFGYLDHDSDLFYLELGENVIEHVADAGNRHAEVIVRWDSMFVGV